MIVITRKKTLEKQHILIQTFLDIISTADQRRKKERSHRSQSKKLIQKQPFKLAFLMTPKTGTAMANRKNEDLPSVVFFLILPWPHTIQGNLL